MKGLAIATLLNLVLMAYALPTLAPAGTGKVGMTTASAVTADIARGEASRFEADSQDAESFDSAPSITGGSSNDRISSESFRDAAGNRDSGPSSHDEDEGSQDKRNLERAEAKHGGPPFDPAGAKNVGNGHGQQFIGGQCLSGADCASGCCAGPSGICSSPGASTQAGKTGCGFVSNKKQVRMQREELMRMVGSGGL